MSAETIARRCQPFFGFVPVEALDQKDVFAGDMPQAYRSRVDAGVGGKPHGDVFGFHTL